MVSVPIVLILASRFDFSCDYVVSQLRRHQVPYERLNFEDLPELLVELDPVRHELSVQRGERIVRIDPRTLRSVYYRRPVYMRDYGDDQRSPGERFSRLQWASFVQNLMLFDTAKWVNHPVATYKAEHKAIQLSEAARIGFAVPETRITNAPKPDAFSPASRVALKGLDTVMLRDKGDEIFGFTTFTTTEDLADESWRAAPGTVQESVDDKLDLRVTIVENEAFAVSIKRKGNRIRDDWRVNKSDILFEPFDLPPEVSLRCRDLVRRLGLRFGAIDLAERHGGYNFLEINPTGEWAWLVDAAELPIDATIAKCLAEG